VHLTLEDYLHWLEAERQQHRTDASLAKYLSHVRGLLEYAWRSGRSQRNVLDGSVSIMPSSAPSPSSLTWRKPSSWSTLRSLRARSAAGPACHFTALWLWFTHERALRARCLGYQP